MRLKCSASTNNVGDPCAAGSPSDVGKLGDFSCPYCTIKYYSDKVRVLEMLL